MSQLEWRFLGHQRSVVDRLPMMHQSTELISRSAGLCSGVALRVAALSAWIFSLSLISSLDVVDAPLDLGEKFIDAKLGLCLPL